MRANLTESDEMPREAEAKRFEPNTPEPELMPARDPQLEQEAWELLHDLNRRSLFG